MDFNILRVIKNKDAQEEDFLNRVWYQPYCTENEIDRILSPKNAQDFLLKKRADIVADNVRFYRVYLALTKKNNYVLFEKNLALSIIMRLFLNCLIPIEQNVKI